MGTYQRAESRRKVDGEITAVKENCAESRRKVDRIITAVKEECAKSRRKVDGEITAVKEDCAESRRNLPAGTHKEPAFGRRLANAAEGGSTSTIALPLTFLNTRLPRRR